MSCNLSSDGVTRKIYPETLSVEKDNIITYNSIDGYVIIEDFNTNNILFKRKLKTNQPYVKPTLINSNKLLYAISEKRIVFFDIEANKLIWDYAFDNKINNYKIYNEELIVFNIDNDGIYTNRITNGELLYSLKYDYQKCLTPDTSPYTIDFIDEILLIGGFNCYTLSAFDIYDGIKLWNKNIGKKTSLVSVVATNYDEIFLGVNYRYNESGIYVLDLKGEIIYQKDVNIETRFPPILKVKENKILYMTYFDDVKKTGSINEFDVFNKNDSEIYVFNKENSISGNFPKYYDNYLYVCNKKGELIEIDISGNKASTIKECSHHLNGVLKMHNELVFL